MSDTIIRRVLVNDRPCALCGVALLDPTGGYELTHPNGASSIVCLHCTNAIQKIEWTPLTGLQRLHAAKRLQTELPQYPGLAGLSAIEEMLSAVGDDELIAVEVLKASDKACYINALNYLEHVWLPDNSGRLKNRA